MDGVGDIIHIDMDAFFASIEQMDYPELKGKPIAVCGRKDSRGVIATASYEARKFGVYSAMPVRTALRKCPYLILVEARFERYSEISDEIAKIFYKYTPIVERTSIDEAYLDVSGSHLLFGTTIEIARRIKKEIKTEFGLSCSAGIAPNKLLAKIASDYKKPDGFTVISKDKVSEFLDNLKIEKLPGIGPKTQKIFNEMGIYFIRELKNLSKEQLIKLFGIYGERIYFMARGLDDSPVVPDEMQEEKSISNEITLDFDTMDIEIIKKVLLELSDKISSRLRARTLKAKTIKLKVKFFDFKVVTRQITLNRFISQSDIIYKNAIELFQTIEKRPVRLLGIGVSNFEKHSDEQLSLFDDKKIERVEKVVDTLKNRMGDEVIKRATFLRDLK